MATILWNIVIQPIVYLIEFVFSVFWKVTDNPGVAIIGVSVAVNLLCLPLYKMADDAQERERAKQASMERWVKHIKGALKGDERYMVLSAYYAEQGYRPVQALVGSLSLLLQIPFFMAAYSYLSNLELLRGTSFLFLSDLGAPDRLLVIGDVVINVLPVVMTLLNCASTVVYTRGLSLRDKLQAYILAGLFLVLLYDSPSGLVFYWTCNQLFSFVKNIFMKTLKEPQKWALVIAHAVFCFCAVWLLSAGKVGNAKRFACFTAVLVGFELLWWLAWRRNGTQRDIDKRSIGEDDSGSFSNTRSLTAQFFCAGALLTCLLGILIPSAVMADSPTEFVDVHNIAANPLGHIAHTVCVWGGTFLLWCGVYFLLASRGVRRRFAQVMWCLCGVCLVDYFFFGRGLGTISRTLVFDATPQYSMREQILNLVVIVLVCVALMVVWKHTKAIVLPALVTLLLATGVVSTPNLLAVQDAYAQVRAAAEEAGQVDDGPVFHLSRKDRNVIILFLDRAISGYIPYIMAERPELAMKFDGFTYYPNTISFGRCTNFGTPALYGGYEYTPVAMNARSDELIADKHNEALLLLPTLFSDAGYSVTAVDSPYAGKYEWDSDMSLYNKLPNTRGLRLSGRYTDVIKKRYGISSSADIDRSFFCYSAFKVMPVFMQGKFYDEGKYLSTFVSNPPSDSFLDEYSTLEMLTEITDVTDERGSFIQLCNNVTHEPDYLQLPDYYPAASINNDGIEDYSRFTIDGRTVRMDTREQLIHYHANAAALLRLGAWFDWMRDQGVYDNTRIIIVADHGHKLRQFEGQAVDDFLDVQMVNPLLMIKDFDAHGFTTSDEFMTNADVPVIAIEGLIDGATNPVTGMEITNDEKTSHDQLITSSGLWDVSENNGTTFNTSDGRWYSVHDDIFDLSNWKCLDGDPS